MKNKYKIIYKVLEKLFWDINLGVKLIGCYNSIHI